MSIFEIIILGILQGLTEFLPVSSSGHLVIAQYILDIEYSGNTIEILFHIGTLGSVLFIFFDDIKNIFISYDKNIKLLFYICVATLPGVVVGLTFKNQIELFFDNLIYVGFSLCFTALILIISSKAKVENSNHTILSSIIIGFSQAVAILPGISRSGMTISIALLLGFSPKESARFSFLLSIPIITGAGLVGLNSNNSLNIFPIELVIVAIFISFLTGVIALKFLLRILQYGKFYIFGIYCLLIGLTIIIL
tara:strand:+ start:524 stop:1276 length:753 start_codon:yes stop_codon:yes gene_type:complete